MDYSRAADSKVADSSEETKQSERSKNSINLFTHKLYKGKSKPPMLIDIVNAEFLKFLLDKCGKEILSLNLPLEWYELRLHALINPPPRNPVDLEKDQYYLQIDQELFDLNF